MFGRTARVFALPWLRRDDYGRIRALSRDPLPISYRAWESDANSQLAFFKTRGIDVEKVEIRPDQLIAFAQALNGEVNGVMRAALASALVAVRHDGSPG